MADEEFRSSRVEKVVVEGAGAAEEEEEGAAGAEAEAGAEAGAEGVQSRGRQMSTAGSRGTVLKMR